MRSFFAIAAVGAALAGAVPAAEKYAGPRPPKPDIPYLLHADNLVATEVTEAKEEPGKDEIVYAIVNPASSTRTPLAAPIFILQTEKLEPEKIELYRLEVKNGRRQVTFSKKKKRDSARPILLEVRRLDEHLYRLEVDQSLENGQYSLTPSGSNQVFCFEVY